MAGSQKVSRSMVSDQAGDGEGAGLGRSSEARLRILDFKSFEGF